jgi:hypothetical protein
MHFVIRLQLILQFLGSCIAVGFAISWSMHFVYTEIHLRHQVNFQQQNLIYGAAVLTRMLACSIDYEESEKNHAKKG